MIKFDLNSSLKILFPGAVTVEVRTSTYVFWVRGAIVQPFQHVSS